jgi:hypothetical protein
MALGDIWLAGPGGSCDNAGTCPNGPCGSGEITICPTPWTHTAEFDVEYTPGGSVLVDGIPRNPGEVFAKVRGDLTVAKPFAYDVEYFRAPIEVPGDDYDPVAAGITSITLSDFPSGWGPTTSPITLTKMTGDLYERRTGDFSGLLEKSSSRVQNSKVSTLSGRGLKSASLASVPILVCSSDSPIDPNPSMK